MVHLWDLIIKKKVRDNHMEINLIVILIHKITREEIVWTKLLYVKKIIIVKKKPLLII